MAFKHQTKYCIKLGPLTNSYFDLEAPQCNLFRSKQFYHFDHEPTSGMKKAVDSGRLIDVIGNIVNPALNEKADEVVDNTSTEENATEEVVADVPPKKGKGKGKDK